MTLTVEEKKIRFPVDLTPANDVLADFLVVLDSVTNAYTFATRIVDSTNTPVDPITGVADDAVDAGNSVAIGGIAKAGLSAETMVAAGDRVRPRFGIDGSLYTRKVPLPDIVSGKGSNTDGTVTTVLAAAGAGIKQYLTNVTLVNMHASTVAYVEIYSGAVSMFYVPVPPGGCVLNFDPPLPPNAANETWRFDPSAAVTTIYCSMVGFKSKV